MQGKCTTHSTVALAQFTCFLSIHAVVYIINFFFSQSHVPLYVYLLNFGAHLYCFMLGLLNIVFPAHYVQAFVGTHGFTSLGQKPTNDMAGSMVGTYLTS